jgi:hypothetical protein
MRRRILVGCLAVICVLSYLIVDAEAQPIQGGKPKANKDDEIYVIMKARFFEVDEAFHKKIKESKWHSMADFAEADKPGAKPPAGVSLFEQLAKQQPYLAGKEVNIDLGKEGVLLTKIKQVNCLPTLDQLRQGQKAPQKIDEGFTLSAHVQLSPDRRFVRAKILEKSLEIEGIEKTRGVVDLNKGTEADGESVFVKESSLSLERYIADGGRILLPLQYRPPGVKNEDHWLVVEIWTRIYIEAEEKVLRGGKAKE